MSNSYIIDNTSGTLSFIIEPGTLDGPGGVNRNSDLYLYGQGSILWGEGISENQLRLAESFACPEKEPADTGYVAGVPQPKSESDLGSVGLGITVPVNGQLWYNTTTKTLYTYDLVGTAWRTGSGMYIDTDPTNPVVSDIKYESDFHGTGLPQLLVFDGTSFIPVAQEYVELAGDDGVRGAAMSGRLTLSADPIDDLHAVTKQYAHANFIDSSDPAGDTMSGTLNMGTNLIKDIVDPVDNQDAMTLAYAEATYAKNSGSIVLAGDLDMSGYRIFDVAEPLQDLTTDLQDAATKNYVIAAMQAMLEALYPINSIFIGADPTGVGFMPGTWVAVPNGTFLMAGVAGDNTTGGVNDKTLSTANIPVHKHSIAMGGAGGHFHNINKDGCGGTANWSDGPDIHHYVCGQGMIGGYNNRNKATTTSISNHSHVLSMSNTGSGTSFNNRPFYQTVQMWKRFS